MAELSIGILGGFSGKVGTVVGANWRGKDIIRAKPKKKKRVGSELQVKQRAKFKLIAHFLAPLNKITAKYFGQYQGSKSRTNLAMSHQLLETVVETGENFEIDYSKVVITKGNLPQVTVTDIVKENDKMHISWSANMVSKIAQDNDKIVPILYSSTQKMFYLPEETVMRSEQSIQIPLPETWVGNEIVLWFVVVNAKENDCSNSLFLGLY